MAINATPKQLPTRPNPTQPQDLLIQQWQRSNKQMTQKPQKSRMPAAAAAGAAAAAAA